MQTLLIATACVVTAQHQLLVVRKRGSQFWMLPGGKLDGAETPRQALLRELQEELQWTAPADLLTPLAHFENQAANEANTRVQAHVFVATLAQQPSLQIAAEIAAMQWIDIHAPAQSHLAPLLEEQVLPALRARFRVSPT